MAMRLPPRSWLAPLGLLGLSGLGLGLLFFSGCWASGPSVAGTIRLDGQPLNTGSIKFIPVQGTPGPDAGAAIEEEGQFRIKKGLQVGQYRVEIQGTRRSEKKVHDPMNPARHIPNEVPVVPPEFNKNSQLIRTVKPGANTFDFDLPGFKGKGGRPGK